MPPSDFDRDTLATATSLRSHGFAVHWLHPKAKRPIGEKWSEQPVATVEQLRASHRPGNNVGVRLGEPSLVSSGYLHVLDLDIRVTDLADEMWEALATLFPELEVGALPCVASGSGGESRHLYLISEKAFRSKKLATSDGKHRNDRGGWSYDWEIELFGTGKQVVLPPSIHPDTGKPYIWLRPFEFTDYDLGLAEWPMVPAADIERLAVAEQATFAYETRDPLTFKPGQFERTLGDIDVSELDYDDWIRLGQAIHHQTGGSADGFDVWLEHTKLSSKFTGDKQIREMRRVKWRSFGKYRGKPVTMATIVEWAQAARTAAFADAFDELPEIGAEPAQQPAQVGDFDDLLGGGDAPPVKSDLDLLGGDDDADVDPLAALLDGRNTEWISLLDLNEEGAIKPTLPNVELMLRHDPRLSGLAQLNEFTQEIVQRLPPGIKPARRRNEAKPTRQLEGRIWQVEDTLNGSLWSDDRDFAVRSILEAPKTQGGYGVKVSDRDLKAATSITANGHAFHPVREYLTGLEWDGKPRVEQLFTNYVGAPNDAYARAVSRMMLVAAVTRIFEPGHKFDFAVILEGLQGKRKSTFISVLGRKWFAELDGDFHDPKQMVELMQGAWIMEIPELSGFGRADVRSIKAFISRQRDRARLAYARRAGEFPRQCIFIGSTNDREYLKDDTGGRRFWPMRCTAEEIDVAALEANIDQIWAEALTIYLAMREAQPGGTLPLFLTDPESRSIAARLQESRRVESADDGLAGRIEEWLSQPLNTGSFDDDTTAAGEPRYRDITCLLEIWVECLAGDPKTYSTATGNMLARTMTRISDWDSDGTQTRFPRWGKQRVYRRHG